VFALVFTLMAGFIVAITFAAARPPRSALLAGTTAAASSRRVTADTTGSPSGQRSGTGAVQKADGSGRRANAQLQPTSARLDAHLASALRLVTRANPGHVAVGVIDMTTGRPVLYDARERFHAARIVAADILATLLWQHQQAGTAMTSQQADLAVAMMERGSDAAATSLWLAVGGARGVATANRALRLLHTIPGAGPSWALTRTTVADQLQLLMDLTSARSPLAGPARAYELSLMTGLGADQHWGASAAASGRAGYAVSDGWLPDPQLWVVNSIGVVRHDGEVLLIAVLSSDNASQAAGIELASDAAAAAAAVVMRAGT
jgi:hypothetical protein